MLQKTLLGWIVCGEFSDKQNEMSNCCFTSQHFEIANENSEESDDSDSDRKLETLIEKLYELKTFSSEGNNFSLEKLIVKVILKKSHSESNSDGRFIVKLPFRDNCAALGYSISIAGQRFLSLEKSLAKDITLKENYADFIQKFIELKHI
jgi:hypothetical protein